MHREGLTTDARAVPVIPDSADWKSCRVPPELGDVDIHVWCFPLNVPADLSTGWNAILGDEERARAAKFAFPYLRERYVAAHAITRTLLGGYLKTTPEELVFQTLQRGKPFLPGLPLHFNLSHTRDAGLLAVTRVDDIGVDIERLDRKVDRHGIASRFFSAAEATELAGLPDGLQPEAFCNLWTRKEAWLKATGVGISEGVNTIEFNCRPGDAARLLRIDGDSSAAREWLIESFRPPGEHVGAVALRTEGARLAYFQFDDDRRTSAGTVR